MTFYRFIFQSLKNDFAMHCAVGFGILIAAAVLTGALLIGDSMRGSLRDLTLDRLGPIEGIVSSDIFVREELAGEIGQAAAPLILLSAGTQFGEQTSGITLIGCGDEFWTLFEKESLPSQWNRDEILINRALADILAPQGNDLKGETISLWVSRPELVPADSALGRREETLFRKRLTVREITPNQGIGRFSLLADQKPQPLAFVPLRWLQDRSQLNVPGKVNTIALSGDIQSDIPAQLSDLGIVVRQTPDSVLHVQSAKLLFTDSQALAIQKALPNSQPVLVYLLETIRPEKSDVVTPYSLVAAIDEIQWNDSRYAIPEDEIVLNDWTADDLGVKTGDFVTLTYFDPESVYGQAVSKTTTLKIANIVPMQGTAADPELVPEIDGVSDADSLTNWNPPFPFDAKKIRDKDEKYWDDYKTTPKAFVSLKTGQKLWGSRFGNTTTFLVDNESADITSALKSLASDPAFGLSVLPVKELGLKASAGTTPFNVLFLSFSFFIIASALMLVVLLFKLAMERKSDQLGTLLALGFTKNRIFAIQAAEGGVIAFFGSILGVLLGIAYAQFLIYGLHHWWIDAIVVPFLTLHISATSLLVGFFCTFILSLVVILWSLRSLLKLTPLQLLKGNLDENSEKVLQHINTFERHKGILHFYWKFCEKIGVSLKWACWIVFCLPFAFLASFADQAHDPILRAGMFFGAGAMLLAWALFEFRVFFENTLKNRSVRDKKLTLWSMAFSNSARNPTRSMLCIGLLASTLFLVLAVGAFRLNGSDSRQWFGFSLIAETQLPVYFDLNSKEGREKLSIQPEDAKFLDKNQIRILPFRVRSGENAGCVNLYQPKTPRILGVGKDFQARIKSLPNQSAFGTDRWNELNQPIERDAHGVATVPIILDANTAMYSLHLYKGVGEIYTLDDGRGATIRCKIVALLSNSFLQGDILMGEDNMLQLFPEVSGFRYFLMDNCEDADTMQETRRILGETIGDFGLKTETTQDRLNRFFAIQNTYLSTFRSLGSIGLFLGTFGMGVVQLRNVLQRRKELALLQAVGFHRVRVLELVVLESVLLLISGLAVGGGSALFALVAQEGLSSFFLSIAAILRQCAPICLGMFLIGFFSNLLAALAVLRAPIAQTLSRETL